MKCDYSKPICISKGILFDYIHSTRNIHFLKFQDRAKSVCTNTRNRTADFYCQQICIPETSTSNSVNRIANNKMKRSTAVLCPWAVS